MTKVFACGACGGLILYMLPILAFAAPGTLDLTIPTITMPTTGDPVTSVELRRDCVDGDPDSGTLLAAGIADGHVEAGISIDTTVAVNFCLTFANGAGRAQSATIYDAVFVLPPGLDGDFTVNCTADIGQPIGCAAVPQP